MSRWTARPHMPKGKNSSNWMITWPCNRLSGSRNVWLKRYVHKYDSWKALLLVCNLDKCFRKGKEMSVIRGTCFLTFYQSLHIDTSL
jgi:hypothetical protein